MPNISIKMFDSAGTAIETLAAEYVAHSDVDSTFNLTSFFKPALQQTDPREIVGANHRQHFRSTIKRGQALAAHKELPLPVEDISEQLITVANDLSMPPTRQATYIDYCDDLYALALLALDIKKQYPTAPVEDALDHLQDASSAAISDELSEGVESIQEAGAELYRTALVVRRANQLFAVLSDVDEPHFSRSKATLGGTLEEAIAERNKDNALG